MNRESKTKTTRLHQAIYQDYRRYRATGVGSLAGVLVFSRGFWATCFYRLSHAVESRAHIPVLGHCLRGVCLIGQMVVEVFTGISLPAECEIGPGLYIGHFGPVILNADVRLGRNCNLSQGVTIGVGGRGARRGCPIIGDRVYVGANAVLIGRIEIGNDCAIGAGGVVTKSMPACAVVAGNPAGVVSRKGSFDFVQYDEMDSDSERLAACALSERLSQGSFNTSGGHAMSGSQMLVWDSGA